MAYIKLFSNGLFPIFSQLQLGINLSRLFLEPMNYLRASKHIFDDSLFVGQIVAILKLGMARDKIRTLPS